MFYAYLVTFGAGLALSLAFLFVLRPLAIRIDYVDRPNARKLHKAPTPYGGGVAVFCAMATMGLLVVGGAVTGWADALLPVEIVNPRELFSLRTITIGCAGAGIFLLGLIDDFKNLPPKVKLAVQTLLCSAVILSDVQITFFVQSPVISFLGTLFWMLLITNAFNLLDNMDGLSSSVALVALAIHFVLLHTHDQFMVSLLTVLLASCIFGFFLMNAPPAKIFMGDAGSLLIGYSISVLSILSTYYQEGAQLASLCTPLLILAIPLYDVASVMFIRFRIGQPFFKADKNHFSHRLLVLGLSPRQALITIVSLAFAMGLGALILRDANNFHSVLILIQTLLIFAVIVVLEWAGRKIKNESNKGGR